MKPQLIFGLLVLCVGNSFAQSVEDHHDNDILLIIRQQYYLLHIENNTADVSHLKNVIRVGDDPAPQPPVVVSVKDKITSWTTAIADPTIAGAMSELVEFIEGKLKAGDIDWELCKVLLRTGQERLIKESTKASMWNDKFMSPFKALVNSMEQEGKLTTKEQQCKFLVDVQEGLTSTKDLGIDIAKLIELIKMIIDLITKLIIKHDTQPAVSVVPPNISTIIASTRQAEKPESQKDPRLNPYLKTIEVEEFCPT